MNLLQLLSDRSIPYKQVGEHQHATAGWVQVDCPFCSRGSKRYRLGINISGGFANCWTCGSHRLSDVLVALTGLPYQELTPTLNTFDKGPVVADKRREGRGRVKLPQGLSPLGKPHCRYLKRRGYDPGEITRLWSVQGIGLASKLSWRLFIPIHKDGQVVSWTTRALGDKTVRYINAKPEEEALPAKTVLYGADYVRHVMIICEGPTDVWRIGPGAVATMGMVYSRVQMLEMTKCLCRVICFDNEPDAQSRARRLARELQGFPGETVVVEIESGEDVADADQEEIEELRSLYLGEQG